MTIFDFFVLLYDNVLIYLLSLLLSIIIFYKVITKTSSSWFNPLRFQVFTFTLGFSIILFLFFTNNVSRVTFVYLLFSIAIFWITFLIIYKNKQKDVNIVFFKEPLLAQYLFWFSYIIYIGLTIFSYKRLGIPLIEDANEKSRLTTYVGSGLGFIARITPILATYSTFYIIYLIDREVFFRKRLKGILLLLPIIIFGILSGSRSSFLSIIFIFWGYRLMYTRVEPNVKDYKMLIVSFVLMSLFSFSIRGSSNFAQSSYLFFERAVSAGDLYWDSLPNENWEKVIIKNPIEYTLMGFFGPMRILDASKAEIPIGFQLTEIVFPDYIDKSTGPVALFPIFGLVCFGYIGGLVFSFIQSLIVSLLLKFTFIRSNSIIVCSLAFYLFNSYLFFLGDMSAALGVLFDTLVSLVLFGFIVLGIYFLNYKAFSDI